MKPFPTLAIPHHDILEGKLTMDVFAASLWQVVKGKAPKEYQDKEEFFRKTYETKGLKNLMEVVQKRLRGDGGDPIIQLQTPFGGGKTHALIALYHKSKEMGAKVVVIEGTALDAKEIVIWEEIERQLTGKIDKLEGKTSPGKEKLENLFEECGPVLILMDEVLQYATKASGIQIGDSTLSAQLLAFMQELTESVSTVGNASLVITLPSSTMEHFDASAELLFQQLQKVTGRMERIYTPVQDEEIYSVIRRRLFKDINIKEAEKTVNEFVEYAEKEHMLPEGQDKTEYKKKFCKSYPFQPEVIDVYYHQWGSYSGFQRTRGVLRLLSLVIYSLKSSKNAFISLSDFDLGNEDLKRELTRYAGIEFNAIIAKDISRPESGSKNVDKEYRDTSFAPYSFGTKIATTIFLYSFSGDEGGKNGASIEEIKLSCAEVGEPSSIINETLDKLNKKLFYIHKRDNRYFFTKEINLNLIFLTKKETIGLDEVKEKEQKLLDNVLGKSLFEVVKWPIDPMDIPDTKKLKLVVVPENKSLNELFDTYSNRSRVYRNTIIFLAPQEMERPGFYDFVKSKLAWEKISNDKTLELSPEMRKEVNQNVLIAEKDSNGYIRDFYRIILLPVPSGFKEVNLGRHSFKVDMKIDQDVYDALKGEEILENIAPLVIENRYLKESSYAETKNILEAFYKKPGELRIKSDKVLKNAIKTGVKEGDFGLGKIDGETIECRYYKDKCTVYLADNEIIIKTNVCKEQREKEDTSDDGEISTVNDNDSGIVEIKKTDQNGALREEKDKINETHEEAFNQVELEVDVSLGNVSPMTRVVNYIDSQFEDVNVKITFDISAKDGKISISDYENRIHEAIEQMGIKPKKEIKK